MLRTLLELVCAASIVAGVGILFGIAVALIVFGIAGLVASWRMGDA